MKNQWMLSALLACSVSLPALAVDSGAVVGGAIGGATGAAIGDAVGGRDGAVIGAAAGAGLGAAIGSDSGSSSRRTETRVIRQESYPRSGSVYYEQERRPSSGSFCPPGQAKKGRC